MGENEKKRVFLVDGHALVYRAFYAMISRPLRTSRGENTSAPWGVVNFIRKLLEEHEPDYLGFIFDAGGEETHRHVLYEVYKATREKLDETLQQDFDTAMTRVRQILEGFRIPVLEVEGYEADDVIATLAHQASEADLEAVIVSGDKDFYQLIGNGIALLNPGRGGRAAVAEEWVDEENAAERLGVPPERVVDYLALVGDSSDNIPGVRGVGPKTAVKLISQFGSLEEILAHADEISGKRARNAIKEYKDEARLSKELVTLREDVPVKLDREALKVGVPDREGLRDLFIALEFHSLVREYAPEEPPPTVQEESVEYELVTDVDAVRALVEQAYEQGTVALDVRDGGEHPVHASAVGLGLAVAPGEGYYLPLAHVRGSPPGELELGDLQEADPENLPALGSGEMEPLADLLASEEVTLVGHDLKRSLQILRNAGITLGAGPRDVMIESYCLDPGSRTQDLESLCLEEFGYKMKSYAELCGRGKSEIPFQQLGLESARDYAAERADMALRLDERFSRELEAYELEQLFEDLEMPLMPVLADMERTGIAIDRDFFEEMSEELQRELQLVEEEIYKIAGHEFNLNSPIQLREVLFVELELPVKKRTKTGPSTDAEVLEELAAEGHEIPRLLIDYRELAKLKSTYVDALPAQADPETDRLHTTFNQTIASTGRLTSSDPNLQNIPIRTALGAEIRKGFVAEGDARFIGADYSQIELRILAHLSHDPAFLKAFREGRDVHRETAALIFGVEPDAVNGAMRAQAKTVNFATIYGQGPTALARQLGIGFTGAREFIAAYFERFPAIREYLDRQIELARDQGYVETILNRRRYIPELHSKNPNIRRFGERVATNSPIQGSAADLIKKAMIGIHAAIAERDMDTRMILQVHDELLFEVPKAELNDARELIRDGMEGVVELDVPIAVDIGVGGNWYETKP